MFKSNIECKSEFKMKSKRTIGIIILVIGILILLNNISILPYWLSEIILSWQMLLIIIGLLFISRKHSSVSGIILITIGAFFLIPDIFNISNFHAHLIWPTLLITIGIILIKRSNDIPKAIDYKNDDEIIKNSSDYINEFAFFGGSKHQIINSNFKGGKIVAIFGGSEIDLSNCKLAKGVNYLDLTCIFGGTSLILPHNWTVNIDVVTVLGGFADKRVTISEIVIDNECVLVIKGVALLGGGEIKNH